MPSTVYSSISSVCDGAGGLLCAAVRAGAVELPDGDAGLAANADGTPYNRVSMPNADVNTAGLTVSITI